MISQNINCLQGCAPTQIINFNLAINDIKTIEIYNDNDCKYDISSLQYAYSVDNLCWSCYIDYNEFFINTAELHTDYYVRIKVKGVIGKVFINGEQFYDYSCQLDSAFSFSYCDASTSSNIYNPYANMDCAISLYQNISNTIACITGIPIYYFKLAPNVGSKDITFKEYALMDVEAVKQIKLIVQDGQMPSSKPEFDDFGLGWQTDWTTEISKQMFATAFGPTAQPMEGDLIYIPIMKRMWMVNEAYEEKRDGFMWVNTTFKVTLVKYQEKGSVDLGQTENLVNTFVKNKYEDLFGDDSDNGSGEDFLNAPISTQDNLYPIYEVDAQRKYIANNILNIKDDSTYYKGTVISDKFYTFMSPTKNAIIYQKKYCGDDITLSFIIRPNALNSYKGTLLSIGRIKIDISQSNKNTVISINKNPKKLWLQLENNKVYFVWIRWSKQLKIVEISAAKYSYRESIPIYKLQPSSYYYDIDNKMTKSDKYTGEYQIKEKSDIIVNGFYGNITNIKLFNIYINNISEIMQMYPTNNELIINDTAKNILGIHGNLVNT